ncbi:hypothetical protein D9613_003486 [Agrocybe pediades]|uniref:F-box domain-containing protein n=1 Tax=Agrocybe pediades TaxID=84607 RepID=A0A8H4VNP2_9AGAR|nr:hypothetical protein D9613_003486 [Agrocybe pediades]
METALAALLRKKHEKELERKAIDDEITKIHLEYSSLANRKSNILSLPLEVTAAIFHLLRRGRTQSILPDSLEVVSQVCHSWRALALSRADYWDSFFSMGETYSQIDRLRVYLERSKDRPFDFSVRVGQRYPTIIEKLVEVVVEHMHRWRRFSLISDDYTWSGVESIENLHAMSAPHLQCLQISIDSTINGANSVRQAKFLRGQADNLTTVFLDGTWIADASWLQEFPNIKTIQVHSNGPLASALSSNLPTETITRLFECPNLESLSIVDLAFEAFVIFPIIKTKAPKLKNLRCSDESVVEFVLRSLDAPKLELFIVQRFFFPQDLRIVTDDNSPLFPSLHTVALIDCSIELVSPLMRRARAGVFYNFLLATNNAKHVYVTSNIRRNMEEIMFNEMADQFVENGTIVYPNMEQLYCAFNRASGEVPDYNNYTTIFKSRTESLKKHCTLHLYDGDVALWQSHDPENWKIIEDGGYYRRVDPAYPDEMDLVPWPPRAALYEQDGWISHAEPLSFAVDAIDLIGDDQDM